MEEPNTRDIELLGMMRAEYSRAKRFAYWGYCFEFIAAVAAVLVIRFAPVKYSSIAPLFVAALATLGFWLKRKYENIRSYAEEVRRATFLMVGTDYHLSEKKRIELENPFSKQAKQIAKQRIEENSSYFAASTQNGTIKLFDMLQESVFWQYSLMEKAAKYTGWISYGFIFLVALALYFMAFIITGPKQDWASELFVTIILVFLTTGMLHLRKTYSEIGSRIEAIDDEMESIRDSEQQPTLTNVLALVDQYNCLIMEAPILPDFIYNWNKDALNETWDKRKKEYERQK